MIGPILVLLLLFFCGSAHAQIVSPFTLPPGNPATSSIPSGAPPQVVGYSAANIGESETLVGDVTLARTGTNQYTATVGSIGGTTIGALATLNPGTGLTATATTLSLTAPVLVTLGGSGTTTAPTTTGQLMLSQSTSAYAPTTMTGDGSINAAGALSVTKIAGTTPGGVCGGGQFVSTISASGVPTCTTPAITGVPSGTAPQIVGYTAGGVAEVETVSGGAGGCSFTRTGANAYQMVCSTYAPTASPTFTGTVTIPTLTLTSGTVSTGLTMGASSTFTGADGGIWNSTGINDGTIKATTQFTFPDLATWTTAGLNNATFIGVGQAAPTSTTIPVSITENQNSVTELRVLNNNTGTFGQAGIDFYNGTNSANVGISSPNYTGGGASSTMRANAMYVQSGMPGGISMGTDLNAPIYFSVSGTTVGQFALNGFHLPAAPLEVSSGGTGTATAPTVGQALVATSTSAYAPTSLAMANISDYTPPTTWTPVLTGSGTSGTGTYTSRSGYYSIVGRLVHVQVAMSVSAFTGTGNLYISPLPQPAANNVFEYHGCAIGQYGVFTFTSGYTQLTARINPSGTIIELLQNGSGQNPVDMPITGLTYPISIIVSCDYYY